MSAEPVEGAGGGASAPPKAPASGAAKKVIGVAIALVLVGGGVVALRGGEQTKGVEVKRDVPKLAGHSVTFSPAFRERAGLKTETIKRTALTPVLKLVGTATFDPEHRASAGTRIKGFVRTVKKVEGDEVEKGAVLAEIESSDLGQAQADVVAATANRKAAELNARRESELRAKNLTTAREDEVARAELEQQTAILTAAKQRVAALGGRGGGPLGVYLVRAPIAGTVVERHIHPGQSVESNVVAFEVANLDRLWIELSVFEKDIGAVREGDDVELVPTTMGNRKLSGKVAHVGEVIDVQTRTARVRVRFDNHAHEVRPGQSLTAQVKASGRTRTALVVPQTAITYVDGKATVFVAESDTKATPTPIRLGESDGVSYEVLEGLTEGQQVFADGVFSLKSELFR